MGRVIFLIQKCFSFQRHNLFFFFLQYPKPLCFFQQRGFFFFEKKTLHRTHTTGFCAGKAYKPLTYFLQIPFFFFKIFSKIPHFFFENFEKNSDFFFVNKFLITHKKKVINKVINTLLTKPRLKIYRFLRRFSKY